jgi:hypothetical protein
VSRENVEVVRRAIDAFNRGELEALAEVVDFYDPEIEYHEDPGFLEAGVYRGPGALAAHWRQFLDAFEDYRFEIEELLDAGDDVVVLTHQLGRGKGSGIEVDMRNAWVFTLRDGKLARIRPYADRAEALAAAGLAP